MIGHVHLWILLVGSTSVLAFVAPSTTITATAPSSHHHAHPINRPHHHHPVLSPSRNLPSSLPSLSSSFHKRSIQYYISPSEFFERYFVCRYSLKSSSSDSSTDVHHHHHHHGEQPQHRDHYDSMYNKDSMSRLTKQQATDVDGSSGHHGHHSRHFNESQDATVNSSVRHSRRVSRKRHESQSLANCPIDCDGITEWPTTQADSVQTISCLDILASVQTNPASVELIVDGAVEHSNMSSLASMPLTSHSSPSQIADHMHSGKWGQRFVK